MLVANIMGNRLQQMRFAEAWTAVEEQGIVDVAWALRDGARAGKGKTIRASVSQKVLEEEAAVCTQTLNSAKNFGIVPQYGELASPRLAATDLPGRYICVAQTKVAKYLMAVDLQCRNLNSPRCVSLYNVSQADGTVLYQRQR